MKLKQDDGGSKDSRDLFLVELVLILFQTHGSSKPDFLFLDLQPSIISHASQLEIMTLSLVKSGRFLPVCARLNCPRLSLRRLIALHDLHPPVTEMTCGPHFSTETSSRRLLASLLMTGDWKPYMQKLLALLLA